MYSYRDKIIKKNKEAPTETEDEVGKALFELQNSSKEESIKKIAICGAQYLTEGEKKILQIAVPFKIFPFARQNNAALISYLEAKFKVPVVIFGKRTILSKYGKFAYNEDREEKGISKETNEQNSHCSP
jgi:hypothetical protein